MPSIKGEMDKLGAQEAQAKQEQLYAKAKDKAESFIHDIDPDLSVEVKTVDVTPEDESKEPYKTLALVFKSKKHPEIDWSEELDTNEEYLDNAFEFSVRRLYLQRMKKNSLLPGDPDKQPVFLEEVLGEKGPDMQKVTELAKEHPKLGVALVTTLEKIINPTTSDEEASNEINAFNTAHMKEKEGMYETVQFSSGNREITVKYYRNGSVSVSASFSG